LSLAGSLTKYSVVSKPGLEFVRKVLCVQTQIHLMHASLVYFRYYDGVGGSGRNCHRDADDDGNGFGSSWCAEAFDAPFKATSRNTVDVNQRGKCTGKGQLVLRIGSGK